MTVPFADLKLQYHHIKQDIDQAIQDVLEQSAFIKGKYVRSFESNFSEMYGVEHCIGVANGTDALYIVMKALGIGPGDEVITVANSWISTSETISQTGAQPVFVDADSYFTIDANLIEAKITSKTKAILPVHLYGQVCEMDRIVAICEKHQLFLIEDAAQAHFSTYQDAYAGTFGIASAFSFYPGKNLGAYGDAGAIITNDSALADKMRMFANHGALIKHQHRIEGINSRLDGIQAAILDVKLKHVLKWTQQRMQNAALYNQHLSGIDELETPRVRSGVTHNFHLYVIKAEHRNELKVFLQNQGIETALHYPAPLPFLEAYAYLGHQVSDFPVVAENAHKILSLPMFPELQEEQIRYVSEQIKSFYRS